MWWQHHTGAELAHSATGDHQLDPLTHAISGAALARAFPSKPLPRKQTLFLVLLTMAPDSDIVLRFFSDVLYLQHHRGLTHSLLMLPLWGWLVYSLGTRQVKQNPAMPWLIGLALLLHISLDIITTFGTMILAPLSDWRASLDLVFIIDPLFTSCMLLPLLAGFIWTRHKRQLGALSLAMMASYLGLAWNNQQQAISIARHTYPDAIAYHALPMAFSPFNWQIIVTYPDHYARTAVNLKPAFTGTSPLFSQALVRNILSTAIADKDHLHWQELPAMHTITDIDTLPGTRFYAWFARFPVVLASNDQTIDIGDLAYGGGAPGTSPAFQLHIELHPPLTDQPRSWLIWRGGHRSELTTTERPFDWL
ncbi:metal-dependent hydrolase [Mariprofundus erugo]|uniref:metal-dependent hydrolase n=1 Tax=Mariprofundus erugo TaxID=2528639 RepID=UPI0010FE3B3D|nr:metal-dependent hydrolase [Mariprofundus erugo]TLS74036.1 metal-dependent hydrolase [Mariprofundus erugo]